MIPPPADKESLTRQAGFTLVELLVVITLFSLLGVLVSSAIRFGVKAWDRGQQHGSRLDEAMHAQNLLRRLFGSAYPRFIALPGSPGHVDFDGAAGSVTFLADSPLSLDYGGRLRFTVSTERQAKTMNLVLNSGPELPHPNGSTTLSARRTLLANVQGVTLGYFGRKRAEGSARWHEDWQRETELPEMLRIRVTFSAGDAAHWPELIIRPRIEADVGCIYDSLAKRCRGR